MSLDLSYNRLTEIEPVVFALAELPQLRQLLLQGNPLALLAGYRQAVLQALPRLKLLDEIEVRLIYLRVRTCSLGWAGAGSLLIECITAACLFDAGGWRADGASGHERWPRAQPAEPARAVEQPRVLALARCGEAQQQQQQPSGIRHH